MSTSSNARDLFNKLDAELFTYFYVIERSIAHRRRTFRLTEVYCTQACVDMLLPVMKCAFGCGGKRGDSMFTLQGHHRARISVWLEYLRLSLAAARAFD